MRKSKEVVLLPAEREIIRALTAQPAPAGLSPDQVAIWDIYEQSKMTALRKNSDYGSSFAEPPILAPSLPPSSGVLIRMGDKVKRINSLNKSGDIALVNDESLSDTINDLGCYCFLYLIARQREMEKSKNA